MNARTIAVRILTTVSNAEATSGPMRAPALSPARSTPLALPYAEGGTREISSVSRAGERRPRDVQARARRIATCQTAVVTPIAAVAKAVTM